MQREFKVRYYGPSWWRKFRYFLFSYSRDGARDNYGTWHTRYVNILGVTFELTEYY